MSSPQNEAHTHRFALWLFLIIGVISILSVLNWLSSRSAVPAGPPYSCPPGHVMMYAGGAHARGYVCLLGLPATKSPE